MEKDNVEGKYLPTREVHGDTDIEFMKKLKRSLIGETLCPIDIQRLKCKLIEDIPSIENVRSMGSYKVLITFLTEVDMEEVLAIGSTFLGQFFKEVKRWSSDEVCQTRRTWVECIGVPLQAWSQANLKKIGEIWGSVICFDDQTVQRSSFSTARILMETCHFAFIQGNIYLQVDDVGYDVIVREINNAQLSDSNIEEGIRKILFMKSPKALGAMFWLLR